MFYRTLITLLVAALIGAASWQWQRYRSTPEAVSAPRAEIGQPAPDFILQSENGPVQLSQLPGAQVLFFGFSHCPDVCPTGLATLSAALHQLPTPQREQLQPLFISLDPERDSTTQLATYTSWFNANILGLTSDAAKIDQVARAYGVFYRRVELPNSKLGYSIDHSADYYLISTDGLLQGKVPHGSSVADLAAALSNLVSAKTPNTDS